jgi:hypothetical protein
VNSWNISIQFLNIVFETRYKGIIKEFEKEVLNEKEKPVRDVVILTQK